jgi:hypothetical protein
MESKWRTSGSGNKESPQDQARLGAAFMEDLQFSLILMLIALALMHLRFPRGAVIGEHLEQIGYALLRQMVSGSGKDDPPVIVIDTSAVPRIDVPGSNRKPVTDRAPLRRFIEWLALPENADTLPLAVGIDINFHNDYGGFLHPDDYQFFQLCLSPGKSATPDVTHGSRGDGAKPFPKIYLGVFGVEKLPPEQWLAVKEFSPLAASIAVPREDQGHLYTRAPSSNGPPTLGVALAQACPERWQTPPWLSTIFTKDEVALRDGPALATEAFLVDYSWLPAFESQAKQNRPLNEFKSPEDVRTLKGKIVLLGDVEEATIKDAFVVPAESSPVPGVYLHACAAATLVKYPLYELHPFVRASADLVLVVSVLGWLTYLRLRAFRSGQPLVETALPPAFGIVAVAVVFTSALLVIFRIFWPDALIVALLLALHPLLEWGWHTFSRAIPWPGRTRTKHEDLGRSPA